MAVLIGRTLDQNALIALLSVGVVSETVTVAVNPLSAIDRENVNGIAVAVTIVIRTANACSK